MYESASDDSEASDLDTISENASDNSMSDPPTPEFKNPKIPRLSSKKVSKLLDRSAEDEEDSTIPIEQL